MFHRDRFFNHIRLKVFGRRLTQDQVDGITHILDFWEANNAGGDLRKLAYIFATVTWETAKSMQPITEQGSDEYLRTRKYWPYIGRGLVQLTWEDNYRRMSNVLNREYGFNIDLVKNPGLANQWEYALPIIFEGMFRGATDKGEFTGKALEDYFDAEKDDALGARAIVNGKDRAREIADIHDEYCLAFLKSMTME